MDWPNVIDPFLHIIDEDERNRWDDIDCKLFDYDFDAWEPGKKKGEAFTSVVLISELEGRDRRIRRLTLGSGGAIGEEDDKKEREEKLKLLKRNQDVWDNWFCVRSLRVP